MATFTHWLEQCPLVAILRGIHPTEAVEIAAVLHNSGFAIVEVPLNSPDPMESINRIADRFGDSVLVGAGTVLDPAAVDDVAAAGGRLIVMPHADPVVVERAKRLGLIAVPGMATLTEAFAMIRAGADALKLFPAEAHPPMVLKAMRAVLPPDVPVLPVGGIVAESMDGYFDAGASGFGLGSALYRPGDTPAAVSEKAHRFIEALARRAGAASA